MLKKLIIITLIVLVGIVIAIKQQNKNKTSESAAVGNSTLSMATENESQNPENPKPAQQTAAALPRLLDLGAGKCIPCKMMAPILDDLKQTYQGKLKVIFIDVWEKPDEAKNYGIRMIPTQIFYDASGKELFRHEGFFAKEDILAKWKELGISLETKTP